MSINTYIYIIYIWTWEKASKFLLASLKTHGHHVSAMVRAFVILLQKRCQWALLTAVFPPAVGFTWLKTDFLKKPCSCFLPSRPIAVISVLICFHESPRCLPSFPPFLPNCQSLSDMPCYLTRLFLQALGQFQECWTCSFRSLAYLALQYPFHKLSLPPPNLSSNYWPFPKNHWTL